ncbi:GGDEF domain-containing protein [Ferrimonas balearica]|uniref:GGDEF domain-containing protein n=1 Tax=Ferrimonas balearica TaxID=44012 RepID=UPI001C96978A|nr:GGDEF domain-containing protein [Ferrimonas balearica]MBY5981951.1 GGDEF domain-containing protein [Ferrimonas balearica]
MERTRTLRIIGLWIALMLGISTLVLARADAKPLAIWDWWDIALETSLLVLISTWLVMVAQARPGGRITRWLLAGLLAFGCGSVVDLLDEFVRLDTLPTGFALLEKGPVPLGLISLTIGLWGWRKEQLRINQQLRTREQFLREADHIDPLTQLCDARTFDAHLQRLAQKGTSCSVMMLDLDQFHRFNHDHGMAAGDELLHRFSHALANEVRHCDLICRYAGDRFVVLLPRCPASLAAALAEHLRQQLPEPRISVTAVYLCRGEGPFEAQSLLAELNQRMIDAKAHRQWAKAG